MMEVAETICLSTATTNMLQPEPTTHTPMLAYPCSGAYESCKFFKNVAINFPSEEKEEEKDAEVVALYGQSLVWLESMKILCGSCGIS